MTPDPLHDAVSEWFETTFDTPTAAQRRGWPPIAEGRHTLIAAPDAERSLVRKPTPRKALTYLGTAG